MQNIFSKYNQKVGKKTPIFVSTQANRPRVNRAKFEEVLARILKSDPQLDSAKIQTYIDGLNQYNFQWFKRNSNDTKKRLEHMLETADVLGCRLGMVNLNELLKLFRNYWEVTDKEPLVIKKPVYPKP